MPHEYPVPASISVIPIHGRFDAMHVRKMDDLLQETVFDKSGDVILDLKDVTFMDSSGIGAIIYLYKRLTANDRALALRQVHGQPLKITRLTGLDQVMLVEEYTEEGV